MAYIYTNLRFFFLHVGRTCIKKKSVLLLHNHLALCHLNTVNFLPLPYFRQNDH